jgi:CheY-like chemotaxis protein
MPENNFLIVDDDKDDCELFVEALSSLGIGNRYSCANNGLEAIEKLETNQAIPDIIFLDINMPGMNGWECLGKLKSEAPYKDIPVIIYTTSSLSKDRILARNLGATCFLTKMYDFKKLKQMLEVVIEKMNSNAIDKVCDSIYKSLSLN